MSYVVWVQDSKYFTNLDLDKQFFQNMYLMPVYIHEKLLWESNPVL